MGSGLRLGIPLLALAVLTGCVGLDSSSVDRGDDDDTALYFEATYEAEGPLYLPGFWSGAENVGHGNLKVPAGSTMSMRVTPAESVLDARGFEVSVINLTYTFEEHWVTHWVHAGTGKIVAYEEPADIFGTRTAWSASGLDAHFGQFDDFARGNDLPSVSTISCCTEEKVFNEPIDKDLELRLVETNGTADWILNESSSEDWTPPGSRDVSKHAWPGRHVPDGGTDMVFPLSEALESARDLCPAVATFMENYPDWKAVAASYLVNPGLVPFGTEEHNWGILLEHPGNDALWTSVTHETTTYASSEYTEGIGLENCGSRPIDDFGLWQPVDDERMMSYADAWGLAEHVTEPEHIWHKSLGIRDAYGGPVFYSAIHFDPYESSAEGIDYVTRNLIIDLDTGLLSAYIAHDSPKDAIERHLPPGGTGGPTAQGTASSGDLGSGCLDGATWTPGEAPIMTGAIICTHP